MPYNWSDTPDKTRVLTLWPHRSLTPKGFAWFIGVTAALFAVPLLSILGQRVLWGILPFVVLVVAAMWIAIRLSWRAAEITERLVLTPDRADLTRVDRSGEREWSDNPYWITVRLHETGGPVPNYLTLKGTTREVEIGSFLSEPERVALKGEIEDALARVR
jgi:uncharacterized membrane protein